MQKGDLKFLVWRFIATVRVAHVKFLCGDFLGDVKVLLCACE